jgi:hypothetical protein
VSQPGVINFHSKKSEIARSLIKMGTLVRWTITYLLIALAAGVMTFNKTAFDIIGSPYLLVVAWIGIEKWLKQQEKPRIL